MDAEKIYAELVKCEQLEEFISHLSDAEHYLGSALEILAEQTESRIEIPELEKSWTTIELSLRSVLAIKLKSEIQEPNKK